MRKRIIFSAVGEHFCFGFDRDKSSAPHRTRWVGEVGPAIFIEEEVPNANASGPVAKHVGERARPSGPVAPYAGKSKWCGRCSEGPKRCAGGPPSVKYGVCLGTYHA